jgi:hypothetical protein
VVTGNLAPHFLALCKPNYTALGCQQYTQFISGEEACTGNPDLIMRARKTFPSKEAALSVYAATYLTVITHFFLSFRDGVSPYSPGCPGTHSVDQAGFELRNPPASASQVLGLKACATTAWLNLFLIIAGCSVIILTQLALLRSCVGC